MRGIYIIDHGSVQTVWCRGTPDVFCSFENRQRVSRQQQSVQHDRSGDVGVHCICRLLGAADEVNIHRGIRAGHELTDYLLDNGRRCKTLQYDAGLRGTPILNHHRKRSHEKRVRSASRSYLAFSSPG